MEPSIIALAIICCFLTLGIRIFFSKPPFQVKNPWTQILIPLLVGFFIWVGTIVYLEIRSNSFQPTLGDYVCGILIFLCAFWCHYWLGNIAGGFRVQMHLNIASQENPISLEKWMRDFGGLGMDIFLKDRIESVLLPWKTVSLINCQIHLLPGWGTFFGAVIGLLNFLLPKVRGD
jgi:hypothetical protein